MYIVCISSNGVSIPNVNTINLRTTRNVQYNRAQFEHYHTQLRTNFSSSTKITNNSMTINSKTGETEDRSRKMTTMTDDTEHNYEYTAENGLLV